MKTVFTIILGFLCSTVTLAQTGPAGVGNSASNGLWLKADDIIQTNNTDVATWQDASGNGNTANQTLLSLQPNFFSTSALNGMPIVRFDGIDDEMAVADDPILDNTSGITYYAVLRPNNLNGSPRGILGKRITFTNPAEYAYTWFFHTGNRLNLDVNTQNNRFNTGSTTFSNATNYILSWNFDGTLPSSIRSQIRSGSTSLVRATENSTAVSSSNQDVAIGALNVGYGTYLGADYAEIIHFNYALDSVDHILVQNYLSAKYNISTANNDIYDEDDASNGNYDFDVAGIGRVSTTDLNDDAQGSGIVRILNPTNLNDNEYLIWGHDGALQQAAELVDVPPSIQARFERVWRVSEVNGSGTAIDVGNVDIRFDLNGLGPVTASDLRLLIDTDNDGSFADETIGTGGLISGATALGGDLFEFAGVSAISNNLRFTIGSVNIGQTPLPIELIDFNATVIYDKVKLQWETSIESNNDFFTIERSTDGKNWDKLLNVKGAGNSSLPISYLTIDDRPFLGISYYRLKQTDFDGQFSYPATRSVNISFKKRATVTIYPNPTNGELIIVGARMELNEISLFNSLGQNVTGLVKITSDESGKSTADLSVLSSGVYYIKTKTTFHKVYKQ